MFRRLNNPETNDSLVHLEFEGREIIACATDTLAAALLASGETGFRTSAVSGESRGPHCLIGNCFDCLLEVDGVPNVQSCKTLVRSGMRVRRQQGVRRPEAGDVP